MDSLYAGNRGKCLRAAICDRDLVFEVEDRTLTRNEIEYIDIVHHWTWDELYIHTKQKTTHRTVREHGWITLSRYEGAAQYPLCKIDRIVLAS